MIFKSRWEKQEEDNSINRTIQSSEAPKAGQPTAERALAIVLDRLNNLLVAESPLGTHGL